MLKKATLALAASILFAASAAPLNAQNLDPRTDDFWASLNLASRLSASIGRTDFDGDGISDDSFSAFGSSSTAFTFYGLNFQSDSTFLYDDYDQGVIKSYGSSLHINRRDPTRYMMGINLAHQTIDPTGTADLDVSRIGGEGEYYFDRFTLGGAIGYVEFDSDDIDIPKTDGWYLKAQARYYFHDNFKLEGYYGLIDLDGGEFEFASLSTQVRLPGTSASLFARWNGLWVDGSGTDADSDAHQLLAGFKFDLGNARGATLKDNDRQYFTDACLFESGVTPVC